MTEKDSRPFFATSLRAAVMLLVVFAAPVSAQLRMLKYAPSPADNPLRGLVPYAGEKRERFPHSMEFNYLPLSDLMTGMNQFNWQPLEDLLDDIASRRHQTVFRIWLEYPGRKDGIPEFLEKDGLKVTEWLNTNTTPFPAKKCRTPDYNDAGLRQALKNFIAAMGKKYDGDPRVGYITAGLLGTWGEWHCFPKTELFASKEVQTEVMDAYAAAFKKTAVLLRYPVGENSHSYARNDKYPLGYHDDSFSWATLDTGRKADDWYFMPAMRAAGMGDKWKRYPIGGEIRPELWGQIFDPKPKHEKNQDFAESVRQTHATWLMDTGMFGQKQNPKQRQANAIEQVQRMGYEFHVSSAAVTKVGEKTRVVLTVRNTGVAPFYYDWPVEVCAVGDETIDRSWKTDWKVTGLLPGETRVWATEIEVVGQKLAVRIVNPMEGGLPVRFANEYNGDPKADWLIVN